MAASEDFKRAAGFAAADRYVHDGACVGLGTGSTAYWAIERIGERVAAGERIVAVPTSLATQALCRARDIPLIGLGERAIDVAIDGADEVAADWSLTKGGGGALFREKAVALAAARFIVIVTAEKLVATLGAFPTPVEVVPFSALAVARAVERAHHGVRVTRRVRDGATFVTDNGNAILDCSFGAIANPAQLDASLRSIHGVVATGIFIGLAGAVLVGEAGGVRELARSSPATC